MTEWSHTGGADERHNSDAFIMINNDLIDWSSTRSPVVLKVEWDEVMRVIAEDARHLHCADVDVRLRLQHCHTECHARQHVPTTTHSLQHCNYTSDSSQSHNQTDCPTSHKVDVTSLSNLPIQLRSHPWDRGGRGCHVSFKYSCIQTDGQTDIHKNILVIP